MKLSKIDVCNTSRKRASVHDKPKWVLLLWFCLFNSYKMELFYFEFDDGKIDANCTMNTPIHKKEQKWKMKLRSECHAKRFTGIKKSAINERVKSKSNRWTTKTTTTITTKKWMNKWLCSMFDGNGVITYSHFISITHIDIIPHAIDRVISHTMATALISYQCEM